MLSFGLDAGFESFPPLANGLVHNRLFQVSPDLNKSLLLPWKPCSWYLAHYKLFKHNESTTELQCTVWKIILGKLILINLCQPAIGVRFFMKHKCSFDQHAYSIPGLATTRMGDCQLMAVSVVTTTVTSYQGQLSLAIPSWDRDYEEMIVCKLTHCMMH